MQVSFGRERTQAASPHLKLRCTQHAQVWGDPSLKGMRAGRPSEAIAFNAFIWKMEKLRPIEEKDLCQAGQNQRASTAQESAHRAVLLKCGCILGSPGEILNIPVSRPPSQTNKIKPRE